MLYRITVMPQNRTLEVPAGENLLQVLRGAGFAVNAVCGGNGSCGNCKVLVDGVEVLACKTQIHRDMTVVLPAQETVTGLTAGISHQSADHVGREGLLLAFDIGTTTLAGYLLEGSTGRELASASTLNPQASYGADVISRIQLALQGQLDALTASIRNCVAAMTRELCRRADADPNSIRTVSIVGNPAMEQLFLGILPENLAAIPFRPVLTQAHTRPAWEYLPFLENATLLVVPNISGFVGADTVACVLATGMQEAEDLTLLVDIGTNGEMVLGNRHRMVACSTAAGPALEGADIQFGMRGQPGAIDHVRIEDGRFACTVIGGGAAVGICGSGIIDAVAAALEAGLLNPRGKILNEDRLIHLTDNIFLTQEDIRQVQLAKGAIAAGITLMADHLGVSLEDIQRVCLAGAFGTFIDPAAACRIGLLPAVLESKITAVGNAAGSGAKLFACDTQSFWDTQQLVDRVESLELSTHRNFPRTFAQCMRFDAER